MAKNSRAAARASPRHILLKREQLDRRTDGGDSGSDLHDLSVAAYEHYHVDVAHMRKDIVFHGGFQRPVRCPIADPGLSDGQRSHCVAAC